MIAAEDLDILEELGNIKNTTMELLATDDIDKILVPVEAKGWKYLSETQLIIPENSFFRIGVREILSDMLYSLSAGEVITVSDIVERVDEMNMVMIIDFFGKENEKEIVDQILINYLGQYSLIMDDYVRNALIEEGYLKNGSIVYAGDEIDCQITLLKEFTKGRW
jgi:hypothetical protein